MGRFFLLRWSFVLAVGIEPGHVPAAPPDAPVPPAQREKVSLVLDIGGHTDLIAKVFFVPSGKELLTVSHDKTVRVWDAASGQSLRVLRPPVGPGEQGRLYAAALSPDGRTLAVAGHGVGEGDKLVHPIYLLDWAAGHMVHVLRGHADPVHALAFSPDGKWLASGDFRGMLRLWDAARREGVRDWQAHKRDLRALAFSPDSGTLASASEDNMARLWKVATGEAGLVLGHGSGKTRTPDWRPIDAVAWSPDGKLLATGGSRMVRLWNTADGTERAWKPQLGRAVDFSSLAFTRAGDGLLITGSDNWSSDVALHDLAGKQRAAFPRRDRHPATGSTLSPDEKLIATAAGEEYGLFLWKTEQPREYQRLGGGSERISTAAWTVDGRSLAWQLNPEGQGTKAAFTHQFDFADLQMGKFKGEKTQPARLERGNLSARQTGDALELFQEGKRVQQFVMGPAGVPQGGQFTLLPNDLLAAGTRNGLAFFDTRLDANKPKWRSGPTVFLPLADAVRILRPSPDDRTLVSVGQDRALRLWSVERKALLLSLYVLGTEWVAWTPEGYYAASPGGERLMGWQADNGPDQLGTFYPAAQFRDSLYRPDLIKRLVEVGSIDKALKMVSDGRPAVDVAKVLPPQVVITTPAGAAVRVGEEKLQVKATATAAGGQPVRGLQLVLDGRPYEGDSSRKPGTATGKAGEVETAWEVRLTPGVHRLRVLAHSAVSAGTSDEVEVTYDPAGATDGRPSLHVLAVGINAYPGGLKLRCAVNDASQLTEVFGRYGKPVYGKVETKLLTDQAADRKGILAGLDWLKARQKAKDVAVIFYAGHGVRDQKGQFYLLPQDGDADDLEKTAVSSKVFRDKLVNLPGRLLVLLDACNSGAVGGITDDLARVLVDDDCGVVVMCAATGTEESREDKAKGHGYFTLSLIEGLEGKASRNSRDGAVYLHHLQQYVIDRVQVLSDDAQHPVSTVPMSVRSFALARP